MSRILPGRLLVRAACGFILGAAPTAATTGRSDVAKR